MKNGDTIPIANGGNTHITNDGDGWGVVDGDGEGGITFGPPDHHGTFNIGGDGLV